jgi:coenzyme F420-dependent glucose-6-phosphate dehydrogenase
MNVPRLLFTKMVGPVEQFFTNVRNVCHSAQGKMKPRKKINRMLSVLISMIEFGYRAVEEMHQPSCMLDFAVLAEKQGFDFVCISDHFHPWFHRCGRAGHAWVWIGAAGAKTSKVRLGTGVTACIYRYNPAIVAQAFATLDELYPGRIFLGVGTGEALNEMPIALANQKWPRYRERLDRTAEAVRIIKALWKGEFVDFEGKYFRLNSANLYTKPKKKIPIYFAAYGPKSARMAGLLGDALMTGMGSADERPLELFEAFEQGVKESGRRIEDMSKLVETRVSYDKDYEKALGSLYIWRTLRVPGALAIADPRELDRLVEDVDPQYLRNLVFTDVEDVIGRIEDFVKLGFNEIQIGSASPDEEGFIREFGRKALPYLKEEYSGT